MLNFENKEDAISYIQNLEQEIQLLAHEKSLATLEHKLQQRQKALEYLFENYMAQINQTDLDFLKSIQEESHTLLDQMQQHKHEQSEEIIKYKNTGKRIRLYTDIAQQK
ncbi:hypothetical protein NBRC116188_16970 [Oceaniserpentilla sp. 4NH20-0058]|uniref:hypothetical protein n=1 Tax=Oceaniserpentilla sp. 4NH20-0058 TaxID=3127660 RepID=UPI003105C370